MTKTVNCLNAKEHLEEYASDVAKTHSPIFIQIENKKEVVLIPKQDYEVIDETAYLLACKENREQLQQTSKEIEEGTINYTLTFNSTNDLKQHYGL